MRSILSTLIFQFLLIVGYSQGKEPSQKVDQKPCWTACEEHDNSLEKEQCTLTEVIKFIHNRFDFLHLENDYDLSIRVSFVVNINGKVTHVDFPESANPDIEKELIRVVRSLPQMIPAQKNGGQSEYVMEVPMQICLKR